MPKAAPDPTVFEKFASVIIYVLLALSSTRLVADGEASGGGLNTMLPQESAIVARRPVDCPYSGYHL